MNRSYAQKPNIPKPDKKYTPVDRHRKNIGEYYSKTQHKLISEEPTKITDIELFEGMKLIKFIFLLALFCLAILGISLYFQYN